MRFTLPHFRKRLSSVSRDRRKRVMVFGDSNSFRPDNNRYCWPALLQKLGYSQIRVVNESCEGRTTRYDQGALNGLNTIADKLCIHQPLDYVIVALGTNDLKKKYGSPSPDEIAAGAENIITRIARERGGIKAILLTPPGLGVVTTPELAGAQHLMPLVASSYRSMAGRLQIPIVDIHWIIDNYSDMDADRIHINAAGRRKIAQAVWSYLEKDLF